MATADEILQQLQASQGLPPPQPLTGPAPEPLAFADQLRELDQRIEGTPEAPLETLGQTRRMRDEVLAERAMIEINARLAGTRRGTPTSWGTPLDALRYLARSGAVLAGTLATPVLDPLTRPEPGTAARTSIDQADVGARLTDAVGRSQNAALNFLEYLGITDPRTPPEPETIFGRIGEDLIPAALVAAGVVYGAPYASRLASYTGRVPLVQRIGQAAEGIAQRPVTAFTEIVGGQPGATALRELASPYRDAAITGDSFGARAGRFLWDLSMEVLGGVPSGMLARRIIPMPRSERFAPLAQPRAPIIDSNTSPEAAAGIIRVQAATITDFIDRTIAAAVERAGAPGLTEEAAGVALRGGLLAARQFAKDASDAAYNVIPQNLVRGATSELADEVASQTARAASATVEEPNFALLLLARINRDIFERTPSGAVRISPAGNPVLRTDITLHDMIQMRGVIRDELWRASEVSVLGTQGNRVLKRNLERLSEALDIDISRAFESLGARAAPFRAQWELANELYRTFNDRFMRGRIGELLMTTRHQGWVGPGTIIPEGNWRVPSTQIARQMLNQNGTAASVWQAAQRFGLNAFDPAQGARAQTALMGNAEDAVRTILERDLRAVWERSQAQALKPRSAQDIPGIQYSLTRPPAAQTQDAANRFLQDNAPLLRQWTRVTTEMQTTVDRLNRLLQARDAHTQNITSQFIGTNAGTVIRRAIAGTDVRANFASLYRQFQGNATALEGLQRAVIDEVFRGHGANPTTALARMNSPGYAAALEEIFKNRPEDLRRLYDMVRAAHDLVGEAVISSGMGTARLDPKGTRAQMGVVRRTLEGVGTWMSGMVGLMTGHVIARLLPGSPAYASLSVPARMSTRFRELAEATWLNDRIEGLSIFKEAVFNPQYESWLRNSAPGNWREAQAQLRRTTRLLRHTQYAINEDVESYLSGNSAQAYANEQRRFYEELARVRQGPFRRP